MDNNRAKKNVMVCEAPVHCLAPWESWTLPWPCAKVPHYPCAWAKVRGKGEVVYMTVQPRALPQQKCGACWLAAPQRSGSSARSTILAYPEGPYEESRQGSWPVISDLAIHDKGTLTNAPFISLKTTPLKIRGVLESWGSLCSSRHPSCLSGRDQGSVMYVP